MFLSLDEQLFKDELMQFEGELKEDYPSTFSCDSHRMIVRTISSENQKVHITTYELGKMYAVNLMEFEVSQSYFKSNLDERFRLQKEVEKIKIGLWYDDPNLYESVLYGEQIELILKRIETNEVMHYSSEEVDQYIISKEYVYIRKLDVTIHRVYRQLEFEGYSANLFLINYVGRARTMYYLSNLIDYLEERDINTTGIAEKVLAL